MDANDVEMVTNRSRRDTDEVYPVDEVFDDEESYQPKTRRQNRFFCIGLICLVVTMLGGIFGATIFVVPEEDAALTASSSSTGGAGGTAINNNAQNAKVAEALQADRKKKKKGNGQGHAIASSLTLNKRSNGTLPPVEHEENAVAGDPNANAAINDNNNQQEPPQQEPPQEPPPQEQPPQQEPPPSGDNSPQNLEDWHKIKVTKDDGVMYEITQVLKHDPESFTEGLTYYDGKLYESIGLNHQSALLVVDPTTGETLERHDMKDSSLFGEGLTYCKGQLIQLTYKALKGFVYDLNDLEATPRSFDFRTTTGEGWGMTYDDANDELIVSDGSAYLHFWDPTTLQQIRKHQIMRLDGTPAKRINELEWWRHRVVANVWYENVLLVINPQSGLVEKEYDFNEIWEQAGIEKNYRAEVFNGISITDHPDFLIVTGKWWSNMFKVKLLPDIGGGGGDGGSL